MNAINVIHPYKHQGVWVFDDERVGLVREPFVAGADVVIDRMVGDLDHPESGFTLLFSANPFPGINAIFEGRTKPSIALSASTQLLQVTIAARELAPFFAFVYR